MEIIILYTKSIDNIQSKLTDYTHVVDVTTDKIYTVTDNGTLQELFVNTRAIS